MTIRSNTAGSPEGFGVPCTGSGILHPTMKNKFRFMIGEGDRYNLLTMQTIRVTFDMVERTIEAWIEQPVGEAQRMLNLIGELAHRHHGKSFSLDLLDGADGVTGQLSGFIEMTAHKLEFDYAKSEVATHHIHFSYRPNIIQ